MQKSFLDAKLANVVFDFDLLVVVHRHTIRLENIDYECHSTYIYPVVPIISEFEFRAAVANADSVKDDAGLAYALAVRR